MIRRGWFVVALAVAAAAVAGSAEAQVSSRVKTACTSDYLKFCSQYPPEGWQTIECMKSKRRVLSSACRLAVRDEGIPTPVASRRR